MKLKKHEIYFDKVDYLQILRKYEDNKASSFSEE